MITYAKPSGSPGYPLQWRAYFLVNCLYQMSPLNHKRTISSIAPPVIYLAKNGNQKIEGFPLIPNKEY